jgi:hypothetical protein
MLMKFEISITVDGFARTIADAQLSSNNEERHFKFWSNS